MALPDGPFPCHDYVCTQVADVLYINRPSVPYNRTGNLPFIIIISKQIIFKCWHAITVSTLKEEAQQTCIGNSTCTEHRKCWTPFHMHHSWETSHFLSKHVCCTVAILCSLMSWCDRKCGSVAIHLAKPDAINVM